MKGMLLGAIIAGAILSSGCATIARGALANGRAGAGIGGAMAYQRGPVYGVGADSQDYHSLADGFGRGPSPARPFGRARRVPLLGPEDSPLFEWGVLGLGVKGFPAADFRRLGLSGYAKNWAKSGLGRSLADISHDPATLYSYIQLRVFPERRTRMLAY